MRIILIIVSLFLVMPLAAQTFPLPPERQAIMDNIAVYAESIEQLQAAITLLGKQINEASGQSLDIIALLKAELLKTEKKMIDAQAAYMKKALAYNTLVATRSKDSQLLVKYKRATIVLGVLTTGLATYSVGQHLNAW